MIDMTKAPYWNILDDWEPREVFVVDEFPRNTLGKAIKGELAARLRVAQRILGLHQELVELRGALRFCPGCKSYCDEHEQWQPIENLLEPTFNTEVHPRICPDCEGRLARAAAD